MNPCVPNHCIVHGSRRGSAAKAARKEAAMVGEPGAVVRVVAPEAATAAVAHQAVAT